MLTNFCPALGTGELSSVKNWTDLLLTSISGMELAEKMRENTFDFNDFIDQLDQVQNMGPMEDLLKMIPGMAGNPALANIKVDEREIARKRAIVSSMTPQERENPDLLSPSRRRRIKAGCAAAPPPRLPAGRQRPLKPTESRQ